MALRDHAKLRGLAEARFRHSGYGRPERLDAEVPQEVYPPARGRGNVFALRPQRAAALRGFHGGGMEPRGVETRRGGAAREGGVYGSGGVVPLDALLGERARGAPAVARDVGVRGGVHEKTRHKAFHVRALQRARLRRPERIQQEAVRKKNGVEVRPQNIAPERRMGGVVFGFRRNIRVQKLRGKRGAFRRMGEIHGGFFCGPLQVRRESRPRGRRPPRRGGMLSADFPGRQQCQHLQGRQASQRGVLLHGRRGFLSGALYEGDSRRQADF